MIIFQIQNLIKIYTKTHQIAPFKKNSLGGMPPNPPSKAHGFAMRSICRFATCKFPNLTKKNSGPPPYQILGTPLITARTLGPIRFEMTMIQVMPFHRYVTLSKERTAIGYIVSGTLQV